MRALAAALLALACALPALADKVVLNDGRTYEGLVLEDTDKQVKIRTARATLTFPKDQVRSVEKIASPLALREQKLEALSPDNPAGYLETAEWMAKDGKAALDVPTLRRLCAIAAAKDPALAVRANLLAGQVLMEAGQRAEAARAFMRAANADPANAEASKKWADMKKELTQAALKEMAEILAALDAVLAERFAEALPKLRRARFLQGSSLAPEYLGMSLEQLADDLQRRVPCEPCAGIGEVECFGCKGKGILTCTVCDGSGKKTGFVAGEGQQSFSKSVCRACIGTGTYLCTQCKAERSLRVLAQGMGAVDVPVAAGREKEMLRASVDLVNYTMIPGGAGVSGITANAVSKGGKRACPTCKGIRFDPPATPPPYDQVRTYRTALDDLVAGRAPFEPGNREEKHDAALLEDGALRYKGGKWIE